MSDRYAEKVSQYSVLDATAGGKHIWHEDMKNAERVVYADRRRVPSGDIDQQPGWKCEPDILSDTRALPFPDGCFDLIAYDPPHRVTSDGMQQLSGIIETKYGALRAETWQRDLKQSFNELWRVLRGGGTLTMKWADRSRSASQSHQSVLSLLPETPMYGTNIGNGKTDTRWWVFHKQKQAVDSQLKEVPTHAD